MSFTVVELSLPTEMEVLAAFGLVGEMVHGRANTKVFIVENSTLGPVAVKILSFESEAALEKIQTLECRISEALGKHPAFLPLLYSYKLSGPTTSYLCLFSPKRGSLNAELERRIEERSPWLEKELLRFCYQLVSLLAFAQEQRIAHRDIKPDNLYLHGKDVCLGDFGAAKLHEYLEETMDTTVVGSRPYASPELQPRLLFAPRARLNVYKSDVYSLGLTLLTCAALEKYKIAMGDRNQWTLGRLDSLGKSYPTLQRILQAMLALDPRQRWSPRTLLDSLSGTYRCLQLLEGKTLCVCLPCHGFMCDECAQATDQTGYWVRVKCVVCGIPTMAKVQGWAAEPYSLQCALCKEQHEVSLSCKHRFCLGCFRRTLEDCLRRGGKNTQFLCPKDGVQLSYEECLQAFKGGAQEMESWSSAVLSKQSVCSSCGKYAGVHPFACGHYTCEQCAAEDCPVCFPLDG